MEKSLVERGVAGRCSGSGRLSLREKVHLRTRELAALAGRGEFEITQADYEQAKRELTGEVDPDRQIKVLDRGSA